VTGVSRIERFRRICGEDADDRALRIALLGELGRSVPFDAHVWVLTDPATEVGSSPVADIPALGDLPGIVRAKYLTAVNRWTALAAGEVASAAATTGGDRSASPIWSAASGYGVDDIVSTVFRDSFGCWGFLDLWRVGGAFTDDERSVLRELAAVATEALRRRVADSFHGAPDGTGPPAHGPAVILLSDDLVLLTRTPQAEADLRAILPTEHDRVPVPASAWNVAAQLLAVEAGVDDHLPSARVHLRGGEWCTFGAARLQGHPGSGSIAVSIERTPVAARVDLFGRAIGLTDREAQLLGELVRGGDTRALADRLHVSPHTVQDHLKSMFAKSGVRTRPALVARATGSAAPLPKSHGS